MKKFLLLLSIFLFFSLWTAACNPATPQDTSGATAQGQSVEEMRKIIIAAFEKQYDHVHRINNQIATDERQVSVVIEYVPEDRYLITSPDNYYQQMIIIADKVYGFANNAWTLLPIDPNQLINPGALEELEKTIFDITFLGQETLNDVDVNIYEYKSKITIGKETFDQQSKLWVGVSDGLPYQVVMDGQIATMDARTGEIKGIPAITTQTIDYDDSIKIEPPSIP